MTRTNPFKYGSIVYGENFYDREDELLRVKNTLAGGNNLTLYAPRRYGKSSLVNKALSELEQEGYTTVYIDFMRVYSREKFIEIYTRAIAEKHINALESFVKKIASIIKGLVPSVSFDSSGNPSFSVSRIEGADMGQSLTDVINIPEKIALKNKWIVAFDEFQEITRLNGDLFENLLRSCIQQHKNVSYLFIGSKTHLLKDMFSNKNRAFYNSALLMNLNKIDIDKSVAFLINRFGTSKLKIDAETANFLINRVAAIPYFIQFVAAEIWQQFILEDRKTKINREDVETAIERIILLKSDFYWEITNRQTSFRKKVLFALSWSADELFSKQTILKYNLGAASSTQKAIERFIEDGIIERDKGKLEFSDPIFKEFLKKNL